MKRLFIVFILAVVLLLNVGCATPYQKKGFRGGYEDAHIKDNIYYIHVAVNGFTSPVTAAQYFDRRAREVCEENGYQDYRMADVQQTQTSSVIYGAYGPTGTVNKPEVKGYVECLKKSE